jgi:hypothetical protein
MRGSCDCHSCPLLKKPPVEVPFRSVIDTQASPISGGKEALIRVWGLGNMEWNSYSNLSISDSRAFLMYMKAKYNKMQQQRPQGNGGGNVHSDKGNSNDDDDNDNGSSLLVFITGPIFCVQLVKLPSGGLLKQFKILCQGKSDQEWIPYMDLALPYSQTFLHYKQQQDRQRITNFIQRQRQAQAEEDTEDGDPEEVAERRDKCKKRAKVK